MESALMVNVFAMLDGLERFAKTRNAVRTVVNAECAIKTSASVTTLMREIIVRKLYAKKLVKMGQNVLMDSASA